MFARVIILDERDIHCVPLPVQCDVWFGTADPSGEMYIRAGSSCCTYKV